MRFFRVIPIFKLQNDKTVLQWKMRCRTRTLICFWLSHAAFMSSAWKNVVPDNDFLFHVAFPYCSFFFLSSCFLCNFPFLVVLQHMFGVWLQCIHVVCKSDFCFLLLLLLVLQDNSNQSTLIIPIIRNITLVNYLLSFGHQSQKSWQTFSDNSVTEGEQRGGWGVNLDLIWDLCKSCVWLWKSQETLHVW